MFVRVLIFLLGLSVLSFGISTVTQAQLGTGSVSSLAYVLTLFTGISMGTYVFLTNLFFYFVGLACVPTKWFKKALMQLPTCFLFAACIDLTMPIAALLTPEHYALKVLMAVIGSVFIGFGVSAMVHARLAILPVEGAALSIMQRFGGSFGTIRVSLDVFLVTAALICSFAFFGELRGLREGTVIAALLSGNFAKFFLKGWARLSPQHRAVD